MNLLFHSFDCNMMVGNKKIVALTEKNSEDNVHSSELLPNGYNVLSCGRNLEVAPSGIIGRYIAL